MSNKKIISLSIWGNEEWWAKIEYLIPPFLVLYKGFELWIYHDEDVVEPYYSRYKSLESKYPIRLINFGKYDYLCKSMIRRLLPLWDESVDYVFCRDIDAPLCFEDRCAIQEFINSGLGLHCINDHPEHKSEILGGLCGFRRILFLQLSKLVSFDMIFNIKRLRRNSTTYWNFTDWNRKGVDQEFLCAYVWPRMKHVSFCHRLKWRPVYESDLNALYQIKESINYEVEIPDVPLNILKNSPRLKTYLGSNEGDDIQIQYEYYKQFVKDIF